VLLFQYKPSICSKGPGDCSETESNPTKPRNIEDTCTSKHHCGRKASWHGSYTENELL